MVKCSLLRRNNCKAWWLPGLKVMHIAQEHMNLLLPDDDLDEGHVVLTTGSFGENGFEVGDGEFNERYCFSRKVAAAHYIFSLLHFKQFE